MVLKRAAPAAKKGVNVMKRLEVESGRFVSPGAEISVLETFYERQYDMVQKGNTDLVTLKLIMLGNALDFIDLIKRSLGVELDNTEKSIPLFEEVMDALSRGILERSLFDNSNSIAKKAGAYLGLLIIANIGGSWEDTSEGPAILIEGREAFVLDFAEKRLASGSELNVMDYYRSVRAVAPAVKN